MFGLEKKEKEPFEFDLEKELNSDSAKQASLTQSIEERVQEIKSFLRTGTDTSQFDNYGVLLHGYSALLRVLNRIASKKKEK